MRTLLVGTALGLLLIGAALAQSNPSQGSSSKVERVQERGYGPLLHLIERHFFMIYIWPHSRPLRQEQRPRACQWASYAAREGPPTRLPREQHQPARSIFSRSLSVPSSDIRRVARVVRSKPDRIYSPSSRHRRCVDPDVANMG
jgi:hypothetical protein